VSRAGLTWAKRQLVSPHGRKFVLFVLADAANESGEANLTVKQIMAITGISRRVVISHLNALIDDGLVKRQAQFRKDGSQAGNTFYLAFGNPFKYIRQSEAKELEENWKAVVGDF
jgi:DNA-binding transcriptional regulator GbsR (MarR family)